MVGVMEERYQFARIGGGSMEPTLHGGDIVVYDSVVGQPKIGDILVFPTVVHRLIWIDPWGGLWHCGDRDGSRPARRKSEDVAGRVVAVARNGKWVDIGPWPHGSLRRWRLVGDAILRRVLRKTAERLHILVQNFPFL